MSRPVLRRTRLSRSSLHRWVGVLGLSAVLAGLAACSDASRVEPGAESVESVQPSGAVTPSESGAVATSAPSFEIEADDLVLADQLDTNAPVDTAALPEGVTEAQVQAARQAWNGRDALVGAVGTEQACTPAEGDLWVEVTRSEDGRVVLEFVAGDDSSACEGRALMVVDAASGAVLEGDEFALFL